MSLWIKENCVSFFQLFCIKVIKTGRVPQHIAFIMDGNRRYAKKNSVDKSTGHHKGFDKLSETLKWCLDLGIPEVTVYAFSIENFKRSKEEVDALMELAREKFQNLLDEMSDEISRAASRIIDGVKENKISPENIDEELISQSLDLGEPELLVRTSGEVRLSDFMLWQISNTVLYFTDVLWPEFTIWNLLAAIIHFQRNAPPIKAEDTNETAHEKKEFLKYLEQRRAQELTKYIS
ncbi:dehydrodolichyl diphosphate synthase [Bombyx mori]|uniref:Alkyl transferase n=1 Tax=Bombyx mori TaxID=7091 RepID=Q1HPS5_BOMMO|nr:dehydrodolichyl diphosphate synthase [Bombyx mori]ABF51416.1 dehydrodolichyl diphosphate synthase [Bombyx mori]